MEDLRDSSWYATIIDGRRQSINKGNIQMIDDVLINNASKELVKDLFELMTDHKLKQVDSVTIEVEDVKHVKKYIKKVFHIVKAAGGVIEKIDDILLIHRLGKWDLPKGKLDKGESPKEAAVREVVEETGVTVILGEKICSTWHTYTRSKKYVLKKTHWYRMKCVSDTNMQPQIEEDIQDVQWMDTDAVRRALYDSYRTIRYVIQEYNKM